LSTRFPASCRWSAYVTHNSPESGSKNEFVVLVNKIQVQSNTFCYKVSFCENVQRQSCSTETFSYLIANNNNIVAARSISKRTRCCRYKCCRWFNRRCCWFNSSCCLFCCCCLLSCSRDNCILCSEQTHNDYRHPHVKSTCTVTLNIVIAFNVFPLFLESIRLIHNSDILPACPRPLLPGE